MDFYKREFFLNKIRLDYLPIVINEVKYKIVQPSPEIDFEASQLYLDIIENNEGLTEKDIIQINIDRGTWNTKLEEELGLITAKVDDFKVSLFKNFDKETEYDIYKILLESAKKRVSELNEIKFKNYSYSKEWIAAYIKQIYILHNTVYDYNNNKVELDSQDLYIGYSQSLIDQSIIREVAHTTPWVNYYAAVKNGNIFPVMSNEKRMLLYWSKFYENIQEHSECPDEDVIEDDDALDGWLIIQNRNNKAAKLKRKVEKKYGDKINKSGDIGIVVTPEELSEIDMLNDERAKSIKRARFNAVRKSGGTLQENMLPDKQQELLIMLNGGKG